MSADRILLIHPGHSHSTSDVYEGLKAGFEWAGAEVIPFEWDRMLRPLTSLVIGAVQGGTIRDDKAEQMHQFAAWLAAADALGVVIDQEINAVVVINGILFPPSRAAQLKKIGIPVACYGTEFPYFAKTEKHIAPFYSHWFTQEKKAVPIFSDMLPTVYLPMAWNPKTHQLREVDPSRVCDVTFVGGGFPERKLLLEGVDWTGIDHTIHGTLWGLDLAKEKGRYDFERGVRYTEGAVPNEITAAYHRSAKIALNMHRRMGYIEQGDTVDPALLSSLGPRAYEVPAVGGFLLSDDERPEIADVLGDSAATFRAWDSADLERQIRYWLAHDDERERRRVAQHQAIQPHHWGNRAKVVLETIFA